MPKPDMTLAVNVAVTGTIDSNNVLQATATYSQGATTPASSNVVDSTGDINLNNMNDSNNDYSNQTDITFMLSGTVTDQNGESVNVVFPDTAAQAVTITQQGGGSNNELTPSLSSQTQLVIDDADEDGQTYTYCLTVDADIIEAEGGPPSCPLDPQIVNR